MAAFKHKASSRTGAAATFGDRLRARIGRSLRYVAAMVYASRDIYWERQVVHYSGLSRYWRYGPVEEVTLSDFVSGHSVWIVDHAESTYSDHEIVERSRSRVGEHGYRLLTNNCEHFCNWCVTDLSRSAQIGRPLELSTRAIDLAASIVPGLLGIGGHNLGVNQDKLGMHDRQSSCLRGGCIEAAWRIFPERPALEVLHQSRYSDCGREHERSLSDVYSRYRVAKHAIVPSLTTTIGLAYAQVRSHSHCLDASYSHRHELIVFRGSLGS
jgi:hypothetical protein